MKKHPAKSLALALHHLGFNIKSIVEPCEKEVGKITFAYHGEIYIRVAQSSAAVIKNCDGIEIVSDDRTRVCEILTDLRNAGFLK